MNRKTIIVAGFLVLFSQVVFSQKEDSVKLHLNHYTLKIGVGWTHYINSLEYGDEMAARLLEFGRGLVGHDNLQAPPPLLDHMDAVQDFGQQAVAPLRLAARKDALDCEAAKEQAGADDFHPVG
ncbi:MAG: hypothetical protein WCL00_15975, partial [Bacteroidota bacterium]